MRRGVHIVTRMTVILGILDDEGNVAPQEPINLEIGELTEEAFSSAHKAIAEARDSFTSDARD